jgi:transposase
MNENTINHRCPNCARLEAKIAVLEKRVAQLEQLLEKATRANKRQAAPFSKRKPKAKPKKPGRKAGKAYGKKAHRLPPDSEQEIDEIMDVPLPNECPDCGGVVEDEDIEHQFQVEIPRKPLHRRFDIHIGRCRRCGKRVKGRHSLQSSDALGAAGAQLGPVTQATIALFKNKYGLSYGKICGILKDQFGVDLSRGGAAQIVQRAGRRSEAVYQGLCQMIRQSSVVYPDETGWKIGGYNHWLWVFVTQAATIYVIRPGRGHEVPEEILGPHWSGTMVHDGWSPYDFFAEAQHQQCLAHLLDRARNLIQKAVGRAREFPKKTKKLLQDALDLRDRREKQAISEKGLAIARGRLEKRLDRLLGSRLSHEDNQRFQNHLARHGDEIFTFLYQRDIEATNWPAEQAIRPAVVNRKVFGGNRTKAGAHAQEVLASVFVTCAQRGQNALDYLSKLIRSYQTHRVSHALA